MRANVRDLRNNFSKLEAWLEQGEQVCIEKRGEPVAMLTAMESSRVSGNVNKPNYKARRKAIWGDRVFSVEEVKAMRDDELQGKEG